MEFEVRHLRVLCAIADTGSLRQAARRLGVSQPALTTQLQRIERSVGAALFSRERTGCRPTLLGRAVLSRARPLVDGMSTLVEAALAEAEAARSGGPRLRIGSTASRVIGGWLRRLRVRLPDADISLRVDVSARELLRTVAAGRLDVAFVHEVEGCPLTVPEGLCQRVLLEREPQFISLSRDHPAAARPVVDLDDLAGDRWMVDPSVDGEWDGVRRVLGAAGLDPPVLHGDYLTAASLVVLGEAVAPCQPTSGPREDMAIRPLRGDPLAVRLLLVSRPGWDTAAVYAELEAAYREAAQRAAAYHQWLLRHRSPLVAALP
ncbi:MULTISPECIES: LysR family transcriptional regulator [Streptomyces]|uniref:LysR family transcriptional regulator n=1 Tax=Streptomyces halstedii TaxID=1944 RepID=A0A6N9U8M8_STRHA|nr:MULTISPECIES: LysR family transcriptional regulator [Streptomyces]AWL40531.1 LysR family transcriptional regulator [Streptomyces sp. SM18]MBV7670910.1 LysR family transcriptional regulator [Streptomyces halstedii]NEA18373.1 LysR family transcriptional regulator [Streptomyces halstedii]